LGCLLDEVISRIGLSAGLGSQPACTIAGLGPQPVWAVGSSARWDHQQDWVIRQPWSSARLGQQLVHGIGSSAGLGPQPGWVISRIGSSAGLGHQPAWVIKGLGHQPGWVLSWIGSSARLGMGQQLGGSSVGSLKALVHDQLEWALHLWGGQLQVMLRPALCSGCSVGLVGS